MCMCVYMCVYIYIHTHTYTLKVGLYKLIPPSMILAMKKISNY